MVKVVRGLVDKPTLERQAQGLRQYYTHDVGFTHYYINTAGVDDLVAIYNLAHCLLSCQGVEFQKIVYDRQAHALTLRLRVFVRPLHFLPLSTLRFLVLLELQDHQTEGGKKKIEVQRDYFEWAPILTLIPILGPIYESDAIRSVIGSLLAATFDALKQTFEAFKQTFGAGPTRAKVS